MKEIEYLEARNGVPAGYHLDAGVVEKVLPQRELFEVGKKANPSIQDRQAIGSQIQFSQIERNIN